MRFFNTAGSNQPELHYCIPALERPDLDEALRLVRDQKYFVLHAPRQTGKTSVLLALRGLLNGQGYRCLYATVEGAGASDEGGRKKRRGRCSPAWLTRRGLPFSHKSCLDAVGDAARRRPPGSATRRPAP